MTVHRLATPYVESTAVKRSPLPNHSGKVRMPFEFWADFHVYGFLWTPNELRWYLDGKEVFSRPNDYFTRPLHIVFDCEIMQDWVSLPDPEDLPAAFEVDYLRVWQRRE